MFKKLECWDSASYRLFEKLVAKQQRFNISEFNLASSVSFFFCSRTYFSHCSRVVAATMFSVFIWFLFFYVIYSFQFTVFTTETGLSDSIDFCTIVLAGTLYMQLCLSILSVEFDYNFKLLIGARVLKTSRGLSRYYLTIVFY